jgi:hypothetical protein
LLELTAALLKFLVALCNAAGASNTMYVAVRIAAAGGAYLLCNDGSYHHHLNFFIFLKIYF